MKPLTLDGEPFVLNGMSPLGVKIKKFLDAQPPDKLFRVITLAEAISSTTDAIKSAVMRNAELAPYSVNLLRPTKTKVYGNPKACAQVRAELEGK